MMRAPSRTWRRWALIVTVVALGIAAAIAGGWWLGHSTAASVQNSQQAANASVADLKLTASLKAEADQRTTEILLLRNEIAGLQAGTDKEQQILELAGLVTAQLEQQMTNICTALNETHVTITSCTQVSFIVPPAGNTTTTTHPPPPATVQPSVATPPPTTAARAPTTTTTTRPHGKPPAKHHP